MITVTVNGIGSVVNGLTALAGAIPAAAKEGIDTVGLRILEDMIGKEPYLHGGLKRSTRMNPEKGGALISAGEIRLDIGAYIVYAHYQEVGMWFQHPRGGQARFGIESFLAHDFEVPFEIEAAISRRLESQ